MKRVFCCILIFAMLMSLAVSFSGCGGAEKSKADGKFTVFGFTETNDLKPGVMEYYTDKWEANCPDYEIEWVSGDISMIMASGDYPEIFLRGPFQNIDVAKYASQKVFLPLDEYISEDVTPNICKMFEEQPQTRAIATSPDGHIYALPNYGGNKGSYIETFWWINRAWLDKLGLDTPTTLPELKEVLRAFKTGDPNGNGKADEIPMTFFNEGAYNYPETLLSCWGVSTKFGMYDSYLNVQKGEVGFTPMMDEWKEMIKFYADLYKEGLLDIECFTYENNTFNSKLKSETPVIGVTFAKENPFGVNADQYEVISPISADGVITPVVHVHPGSSGLRNIVHITSACEDPVAAMKWIDTFYSKEATITNWYGEDEAVANGKVTASFYKEGDMYKWLDYEAQGHASISEMYNYNSPLAAQMAGYMSLEDDRGVYIEDCDAFNSYDELYEMYAPYLDPETWPRPYYAPEDSTELSALQTDIFNYVEKNKADWIMGRADVEKDWDGYIAQLKKLGADRLVEINSNAYKIYKEAEENIK